MKIAIVIEQFDPAAGGNERSTHQIARRLLDRGHAVTILTSAAPDDPQLLPGGTVRVRPHSPGTRSAVALRRFVAWAERQLAADPPEVSLSMTTAVPADVMQPRGGTVRETLGRNIARRHSARSRWTKRLALALNPKQRMLLSLERRAFMHPRVRRIVAISQYVADQLEHHYGLSGSKVPIIPNAAEPPTLSKLQQQLLRQQMRRALNIGEGDVAFLFAAMNPSLKGLPQLLQAFATVSRECRRARLIVAGSIRYADFQPVMARELADTVRWVGPTRRMEELYAACDVTVLPTWYDPSSKVVLESLLRGKPAITTLYNGAAQWVWSPTGRCRAPSPYGAFDGTPHPEDSQPAGRCISDPTKVQDLISAMLDLCNDDERARCAVATIGLDRQVSMDQHVHRLLEVLEFAAHAQPGDRRSVDFAEGGNQESD